MNWASPNSHSILRRIYRPGCNTRPRRCDPHHNHVEPWPAVGKGHPVSIIRRIITLTALALGLALAALAVGAEPQPPITA